MNAKENMQAPADDLEIGSVWMIVGVRQAEIENPADLVRQLGALSGPSPLGLKGRPLRIVAVNLPFLAVEPTEFPDSQRIHLDVREVILRRCSGDYVDALALRRPGFWRRLLRVFWPEV